MEIKFVIDGHEIEVTEMEYRMILGGLTTTAYCLMYPDAPAKECIKTCAVDTIDWKAQKERNFLWLESKLHWDWQKGENNDKNRR